MGFSPSAIAATCCAICSIIGSKRSASPSPSGMFPAVGTRARAVRVMALIADERHAAYRICVAQDKLEFRGAHKTRTSQRRNGVTSLLRLGATTRDFFSMYTVHNSNAPLHEPPNVITPP